MKIAVPKEIKNNENRVGLVPSGVRQLVQDGHEVYVQKTAGLGVGITDEDFINAGAKIGNNCIINSHALVEHDAKIEDHCHISTGALVNGNVIIGKRSFIGSGTIIREGVRVGENAVIGAGRVVMEDVPNGTVLKHVK